LEFHKFLHCTANFKLAETNEYTNTVFHVHDVIVDLKVTKIVEEHLREGAPAVVRLSWLNEHVEFGIDLESGIGQPKPTR
jgi:hypothetical protein